MESEFFEIKNEDLMKMLDSFQSKSRFVKANIIAGLKKRLKAYAVSNDIQIDTFDDQEEVEYEIIDD
jgi:hypothetical protein